MRFSDHGITDRALLREAVAEWQFASGPAGEISREIFEQQAVQGYYNDAAATGHNEWNGPCGVSEDRTENGDLWGLRMMKRFAGSDLGAQIAKSVALAQVSKGDLEGALETAGPGVGQDEIFLAFARRQVSNGDFAAALETSARMKSPHQVFYEVGEALQERREQNRVRGLASGMTDRRLAECLQRRCGSRFGPPHLGM